MSFTFTRWFRLVYDLDTATILMFLFQCIYDLVYVLMKPQGVARWQAIRRSALDGGAEGSNPGLATFFYYLIVRSLLSLARHHLCRGREKRPETI